jgi:hypothetical protein
LKASSRVLFVSLAGAGVLCFLMWRLLDPTRATPSSTLDSDAPRAEAARDRIAPPAPEASAERRAVEPEAVAAAAKEAPPAAPPPPKSAHRLRGRTLDVQGVPVPGVHVGTRGRDGVLATSDASGTFELELPAGEHRLVAVDDAWVTVRYDQVLDDDRERERFLIVAPPVDVGGRVVDSTARPLEGAVVHVDTPLGAFARFPLALDSTGIDEPETKTSADGSFELKRVPSVAGASLETKLSGFNDDNRPLPRQSVADLVIELKDPTQEGAFVEGVVVHEDGKPAPGAEVHFSDSKATTDAEGRFRLALGWVDPSAPLVAVLRGFRAAVLPEFGKVIESNDRHPPPARLVLGGVPLAIAGRVLGPDDKPQAGWRVSLTKAIALSGGSIPVVTAERVTAPEEAQSTTGDDGRFRIGGLRDADYRLQAWNGAGLRIESEPIRAGTEDAELRVAADAFLEKVTGRVVGKDGLPVPDLFVGLQVVIERTAFGSASQQVQAAKTGKDGTFEFLHVARHFARLTVGGESIEFKMLDLDEFDLARSIEIVVARMFRFRFESRKGEEHPTWMEALDADGKKLSIVILEAGSMMTMDGAQLFDGNSHVLSVSEEAVRLLLYRDKPEREVFASQPLHLVAGDVNVVHRER